MARVHHRRELRVLRLVGLALRLPARRLHALEPPARGADRPLRRGAHARSCCSGWRSPGTSPCSATSSTTTSSSAPRTTWPSRSGSGCRSTPRSIVLPVGISFYTFMAISYVVDTYRGDFKPVTLGKFAAYLSFFPHLVAGPIVRPARADPADGDAAATRGSVDTSRAFYLIATGLFKKVVIANYLAAHITDQVFAVPGSHSSLEILDRDLRLRRPDLRRLLGLHRHGDRDRAAARASSSRRTSTRRTPPPRSRASGVAGT